MIAPAYYWSKLASAERDTYRDIVAGLLQRKAVIHIKQPCNQINIVRKIVTAVHLDHPELFYVDFWHYQITQTGFPYSLSVRFQMMLDANSSAAVMHTLNAKVRELQKVISKSSCDEEAYFLTAKEITSTTKYVDTNSAFWDHTVAGVLRHSAVCEGIAKLFLFYCQKVNIPCAIVIGSLNDEPHAWNMVEINGIKKYIDITAVLPIFSLYKVFPKGVLKNEQYLRRTGYNW